MRDKGITDLMAKYRQRLGSELGNEPIQTTKFYSKEYESFRNEYLPKPYSFYEKGCNFSEKVLGVKPDAKVESVLLENIEIAHLQITPKGVASFALLMPVIIIFLGIIFGVVLSMIVLPAQSVPISAVYLSVFFIILGAVSMLVMNRIPAFIANEWRLKASNQMVLAIFYVVTFMRHTSNLEGAIRFASDHLTPPLSLDFKRVIWEVESEKYSTIKEALDIYLETWRKWNIEFIESMHLIEGSLFEGSEERRLTLLDKALDVILNGTYEKMLHFAHDLKSPITILYMLGLIMPILFLVILPLVVSFMTSALIHPLFLVIMISSIYNFALPGLVFLLGKNILSTRPTGYGDSNIEENNPELEKYKYFIFSIGSKELRIHPFYLSVVFGVIFILIGLLPLIIGFSMDEQSLIDEKPFYSEFKFMDFHYSSAEGATDQIVGPYGIGASLISLMIILGLGLGFGIYYKATTKKLMEIRAKTKELEDQFASGLFQLGNRLGDGIPAEIAFTKVAISMQGTTAGDFMQLVAQNITQLGMSVQDAIFSPRGGALLSYPSALITSSMKVLVQSVKKGPRVASQALINISRYIKEIHSVNERLKDLLSEIVSSMNSQLKFLAPAIAGIVVGITTMVITILGQLSAITAGVTQGQDASVQSFSNFSNIFGDGVPGFYFQTIIGIYIVQIVFILSALVNGIENGSDKLNEKWSKGSNLVRSTLLYVILSATVMILFNLVAVSILTSFKSGI